MGLLMAGGRLLVHGRELPAVVTGAYRAVVYIKDNMKLDAATASTAAPRKS